MCIGKPKHTNWRLADIAFIYLPLPPSSQSVVCTNHLSGTYDTRDRQGVDIRAFISCSDSQWVFILVVSAFSLLLTEQREAKQRKRRKEHQLKHEEAMAAALKVWNSEILPNWENMWVTTQ